MIKDFLRSRKLRVEGFVCLNILVAIFLLPQVVFGSTDPAESYGFNDIERRPDRPMTSCSPGQSHRIVSVREYTSNALINPSGMSMQLEVYNRAGSNLFNPILVRGTGWVPNTARLSLCHDPLTEGIRVSVRNDGTGLYHDYQAWPWWLADPADRSRWANRDLNQDIYLKRRTDTAPTVVQREPHNVIVRDTPNLFRVDRRETFYQLPNYDAWWLGVRDAVTLTSIYRQEIDNSGRVGSVTFPVASLPEGLLRWIGPQIALESGRIVYADPLRYSFFRIDRTRPTATRSVVVTGAPDSSRTALEIRANVNDLGSGLARVDLIVRRTSPRTIITAPSYNFIVQPGILGGPTGLHTVSFPLTLQNSLTYEYAVQVTDAAGNVRTLPFEPLSFTTLPPPVPPVPPVVPLVTTLLPTLTLTPQNSLVRRGSSTSVAWSVTNTNPGDTCALQGTGNTPITLDLTTGNGTELVTNITNQIVVRLVCVIADTPYTREAVISVVPSITEI